MLATSGDGAETLLGRAPPAVLGQPRPAGARQRTLAGGRLEPSEDPIYTLPVIIVSFAVIIVLAIWIEMPLWMVGLTGVLALVGYLLERKRST